MVTVAALSARGTLRTDSGGLWAVGVEGGGPLGVMGERKCNRGPMRQYLLLECLEEGRGGCALMGTVLVARAGSCTRVVCGNGRGVVVCDAEGACRLAVAITLIPAVREL